MFCHFLLLSQTMQPRPQCFSVTPYYRRHFLDMANGFQIWSTQAGHEETAGGIWANQTEKYFEWVLIYDGEERTVCKNCAAASLYTVAWLTYFPYINIWEIFISNHLVVEMWVGTWDRLGQPTNQSNEIPRNCLCAWAKRLMLRRKATHRWNVIEANTYSVVLECGSSCTFSISKVQCVDLENKM